MRNSQWTRVSTMKWTPRRCARRIMLDQALGIVPTLVGIVLISCLLAPYTPICSFLHNYLLGVHNTPSQAPNCMAFRVQRTGARRYRDLKKFHLQSHRRSVIRLGVVGSDSKVVRKLHTTFSSLPDDELESTSEEEEEYFQKLLRKSHGQARQKRRPEPIKSVKSGTEPGTLI
jgi:hypothetical protein